MHHPGTEFKIPLDPPDMLDHQRFRPIGIPFLYCPHHAHMLLMRCPAPRRFGGEQLTPGSRYHIEWGYQPKQHSVLGRAENVDMEFVVQSRGDKRPCGCLRESTIGLL